MSEQADYGKCKYCGPRKVISAPRTYTQDELDAALASARAEIDRYRGNYRCSQSDLEALRERVRALAEKWKATKTFNDWGGHEHDAAMQFCGAALLALLDPPAGGNP